MSLAYFLIGLFDFFLLLSFESSLYILKLDMCKIFLSVYTLSFHLNNRVFDRTKVFNFDKVQLMNFTLWIMLSVSSLTHCLAIDSDNFLGFFSLKLLHFTFKYVNHFEFFFLIWCEI